MGKRFLLAGLIAMLGAGCGSESWVTIAMMDCNALEELEKDPKNFAEAMGNYIGRSACMDAGGLVYANDYRCNGDKVEVRCEEQ